MQFFCFQLFPCLWLKNVHWNNWCYNFTYNQWHKKGGFHQMYNFIYDPFCNRWYAPNYLLSAVQSPVQRTVKLRSCRQAIVWRMEKLTLHIIAVLISHRSEHPWPGPKWEIWTKVWQHSFEFVIRLDYDTVWDWLKKLRPEHRLF